MMIAGHLALVRALGVKVIGTEAASSMGNFARTQSGPIDGKFCQDTKPSRPKPDDTSHAKD
ncbi:hypothetical protein [Campylobacter sp.]|uniref:hypothetical protein n=1 Tax=Campylobacter sp. TaxID=205 RepID=UPI0026DB3EFF|nr:hypothetical protein [Campylobacter sp.]MDO4674889.1 hypothetical protein [Campylobacter sp.]